MKSGESIKRKWEYQNEHQIASFTSIKLIKSENDISTQQVERSTIIVSPSILNNTLLHYQWRSKTQFPIVKILNYKIYQESHQSVKLEIVHERFPYRLMYLKEVPLFKILYLLKQSLIGFERLFDRFGSFLVTPKMIGISKSHKCKVWLNENFANNQFKSFKIDQRYFLISIYKMFENRCVKIKNSTNFFQEINNYKTFYSALGFIESYIKENKIVISTSFRPAPRELYNETQTNFDPTLTISRSPRFLNSQFRDTLGLSQANQIVGFVQKQIQRSQATNNNVNIHEDLLLKKSAETATDVYKSKTISNTFSPGDEESAESQQNQKDKYFEAKEPQKFIFKSQLPIKHPNNINIGFKRKLSNNFQNFEIIKPCYTPQYRRDVDRNVKDDQQWNNKANIDNKFYCQEDQVEPTNSVIGKLFSKNQWQKTINGLFSEKDSTMKKSIHEGKEVRKDQLHNLQLLGNIGKDVYQSVIENEFQKLLN